MNLYLGSEKRESTSSNKRKQEKDTRNDVGPTNKKSKKDDEVNSKLRTKSKVEVIADNPLEGNDVDMDSYANGLNGPHVVAKNNQNTKVSEKQDETKNQNPKDVCKQTDTPIQGPSTLCRRLVEYDDFEMYGDYESIYDSVLDIETITSKTDTRKNIHLGEETDISISISQKSSDAGPSDESRLQQSRVKLTDKLKETEINNSSGFDILPEGHVSNENLSHADIISNDKRTIVSRHEKPSDLRNRLNKARKSKKSVVLKRYDLRNQLKMKRRTVCNKKM